jgi:PTH1 family peptidyl-tRNA hydrolase
MLQLAVFLGNPGRQYENNRHNAGRMVADRLPFFSASDWQKKFKGLYAGADYARIKASAGTAGADITAAEPPPNLPSKIHFLIPETFMNLTGESALAAASFYKIKLDEIIVIYDEIELPFGTLSLKFSGGLGGHNGLRSMKACFGSADFWRLRVGLGRPDGRVPGRGGSNVGKDNGIAGWVLSDFDAAEAEALAPVFETGAGLLMRAIAAGPERLLPEWTKKNCLLAGGTELINNCSKKEQIT